MAFSVQNDAGTVLNANAYITVAEFKSYHDDRGNSYGSPSPADALIQKAIVKATDYVDARFSYIGDRSYNLPTEWPRLDAVDPTGYLITGIPPSVKEACAEYALRALTGSLLPDPQRDASGRIVDSYTKTVGPISKSVTFSSSSGSFSMPIYPVADQKLLKAGLVNSQNRVTRG